MLIEQLVGYKLFLLKEFLNIQELKRKLFGMLSVFLYFSLPIPTMFSSMLQKYFTLCISFFSEIDFLKNENFAVSTVYGVAPHPSLKQVPLTVSEDNGRYLDIKSSENDNKHGNTEETNLSLSAEVDSRTSKDDTLNSVPHKETEKLSSCAQSTKPAVHFDKPNRLVISFKLECFN